MGRYCSHFSSSEELFFIFCVNSQRSAIEGAAVPVAAAVLPAQQVVHNNNLSDDKSEPPRLIPINNDNEDVEKDQALPDMLSDFDSGKNEPPPSKLNIEEDEPMPVCCK